MNNIKRRVIIVTSFIAILIFLLLINKVYTIYSVEKQKEQIRQAMETSREEKKQKENELLNDKVKPVIKTALSTNVELEMDESFDYQIYKASLSADDNLEGDITNNIYLMEDTYNKNKEGSFTVSYGVKDSAGNEGTISFSITAKSKYSESEVVKLNSCVEAYNKLSESLKSPGSLSIYNIATNEDGTIVYIDYSAANSYGAKTRGKIVYDNTKKKLYEADDIEISKYIIPYTYEYDDIKDFSDYYHPKD